LNQKASLSKVNAGDASLFLDLSKVSNTLFEHVYTKHVDAITIIRECVEKERLCKHVPHIRFNFPRFTDLRDLKSDRLGKFCAIKGIVRSISKVQPWIITAVFECRACGTKVREKQDTFRLSFPGPCTCGKVQWELIPEKSLTMDYQMLTVQESPEGLRGGEVPSDVEVRLTHDLVGLVNAGNRVNVYGILKTIPIRKNELRLKTIFDANNLEIIQKEYEDIEISDKDLELILELGKHAAVVDRLRLSIAPSIYGHEILKEAVLLQLFGGVRHKNKDGTHNRGDIHVLIVGDPGVAKSKLLESVLHLCPRGVKASGGGSTKAGLTATAIQDANGQWMLEAGAVVLADKGHLILDEVDKMNADDRKAIHEAMEQQVVSINKAGINTTLQSRCSILAAANPKSGRFDDYLDLAQQIDLPPTLLSRFDLIFTMTDKPDKDQDDALAAFLLARDDQSDDILDTEFIRKYISYAKMNVIPKMTPDARSVLKEYYVSIRSLSGNKAKSVPITARQLEALMRLSEASARMRLSDTVSVEDAQRAVNILDKCLRFLAYDPKTGQLDIDKLTGKMSAQSRDVAKSLLEVIHQLKDPQTGHVNKRAILDEMEKRGFDNVRTEGVLEQIIQRGDLMWVGPRYDRVKFV
jgi:replicative DNA helicase Mcm